MKLQLGAFYAKCSLGMTLVIGVTSQQDQETFWTVSGA